MVEESKKSKRLISQDKEIKTKGKGEELLTTTEADSSKMRPAKQEISE